MTEPTRRPGTEEDNVPTGEFEEIEEFDPVRTDTLSTEYRIVVAAESEVAVRTKPTAPGDGIRDGACDPYNSADDLEPKKKP